MAATTAAYLLTRIEKVDAAIDKILDSGEEYQTPQNLRVRRARLTELQSVRDKYESQYRRLTGQSGGGRIVAMPAREDGYESV